VSVRCGRTVTVSGAEPRAVWPTNSAYLHQLRVQRVPISTPVSGAAGNDQRSGCRSKCRVGLLDSHMAEAIAAEAREMEDGLHDSQFPLDI
jgi:fumarate hydratase class II